MRKLIIFLFAFLLSFQNIFPQDNNNQNSDKIIFVDIYIKTEKLQVMGIIDNLNSLKYGDERQCTFKTKHIEYLANVSPLNFEEQNKEGPRHLRFFGGRMSLGENFDLLSFELVLEHGHFPSSIASTNLYDSGHFKLMLQVIDKFKFESFLKNWLELNADFEIKEMTCETIRWKTH